jgi:hypothetical protein
VSAALRLADKWAALASELQAAGRDGEAIEVAMVAARYVQLAKIMQENERMLGMKDARHD